MSFLIQGLYEIQNQTGIKGQITIDVCPEYQDLLRAFLKKHLQKEKEKNEKIRIPLMWNPDITKRNLDQNALMWRWYDIEKKCLNANMVGAGKHEYTAWEIYENDLKEYCPKEELLIKADFLNMYKRKFRHLHIIEQENDYIRVRIWKTSSHFTIREMAYWINRIINRVADYGVPVDIQTYTKSEWIDYQKWLSKNKIILHYEEKITKEEYKDKVPICEASGDFLGNGGEVAHIKAVGMGGKEEPEKDHPGNWFHLNTDIHRKLIHGIGGGWDRFLKEYPWLKYKYKMAMNKQSEHDTENAKIPSETAEERSQGVLFDKNDAVVDTKCPECGNSLINGTCSVCKGMGVF